MRQCEHWSHDVVAWVAKSTSDRLEAMALDAVNDPKLGSKTGRRKIPTSRYSEIVREYIRTGLSRQK